MYIWGTAGFQIDSDIHDESCIAHDMFMNNITIWKNVVLPCGIIFLVLRHVELGYIDHNGPEKSGFNHFLV